MNIYSGCHINSKHLLTVNYAMFISILTEAKYALTLELQRKCVSLKVAIRNSSLL